MDDAKTRLERARKAWPRFWTGFSQAVRKDHLVSFQDFVSVEFDASGLYQGEEPCNHTTDGRKELVCILHIQDSGPMNELQWIFRAKTRAKKVAVVDGKVTRLVDWLSADAHYEYAEFVFESDGRWRLIRMGSGGT